ncbi:hypothetical protein SORBI_3010G200700 [Sorghum bicolor]|nr:hypothetical protein SORBI_3010G200700 [Sorghum bicolor]
MHQIGSGMYVSGPAPDRKRGRRLSAATPPYTGGDVARSGELGRMFDIAAASQSQVPSPASSSRRSSGPLHRPSPSPASGPLSQLSHPPGLLVGPSPSPAPSPSSSSRKGSSSSRSRRAGAGKEAAGTAVALAPASGRLRLGVPFACYVLVAVAAAAALGAGAYCLVSWRRWEVLAAAGGAVAAVAAVFASNAWRTAAEAERFFRRFPDTVFDDHGGDMPVGELVKITGQVTCGGQPLGANFHDAARCVFTSVQLHERRRWGWCCCCRRRWQLRHSEARVTNFYISDRNSGKRFYVRAGEGDVITPMIRYKTTSFDGSKKGASQNLKNWMATNELSYNGDLRVKEG